MKQLSRLKQETLLSVQESVGLACVVAFQKHISYQCKEHSFPKNVKKLSCKIQYLGGGGTSKVFKIIHTW